MKNKAKEYTPIACHLHDHIESSIVKRQKVHITFEAPGSGETVSCETIIIDWYVKEGTEYIVLESGRHLRLDYLRTFRIVEDK